MTKREKDLTEQEKGLVESIISELKPREAVENRARWFLEMLVVQAGFDVVDVASRVFARDFVSSESGNTPGPQKKENATARTVARHWESFQIKYGRKSFKVAGKRFGSRLPSQLVPRSNIKSDTDKPSKRIQNLISIGKGFNNNQRPTLVRLAGARKRYRSLSDIDGRVTARVAKEMSDLAEFASDEELKARLSEAEYLEACATSALLGGSGGPFTVR